jgi:hypothetical protein
MTRKKGAAVLLVTATGAAIYVTVVLEAHRHQPVYAMPVAVVFVAGVCVALTTAGGLIALRAGQLAPWLAPVAAAMFVYGFFVAGTLIVLPAVVLVLLVLRSAQSSRGREREPLNVSAAGLLTLGLVPLSLLALFDQPVVTCFPGGVSTAPPIWTSFQSSSGQSGASSSSLTPQVSTGTLTAGGVTYTFTCRGSQLVHFASG